MSRTGTTGLSENELDAYVVSKNSISGKKRHKPRDPDAETVLPYCRSTVREEDTWTLKDARHTIFYDECQRCFGGGIR